MEELKENNAPRDRAILVGLSSPRLDRKENADEESLEELGALVETAGGVSVGVVLQTLPSPNPHTFIGEGKVDEIRELVKSQEATMVIFDNDLSPSQMRVLCEEFGVQVLDRSGLILDIFAQRAKTKEGRLQVELAQYQYLLPRLIGMWTHLERQAGTSGKGPIGSKGPGETQLETDRRHIHRKIDKLKADLEEVRRVRATQRDRRSKNEIPVVAIVGYTNAGKSTLLNALTGAGIPANNRLFDTLDTTTRLLTVSDTLDVVISDTVGFIRKLPPCWSRPSRQRSRNSNTPIFCCTSSTFPTRTGSSRRRSWTSSSKSSARSKFPACAFTTSPTSTSAISARTGRTASTSAPRPARAWMSCLRASTSSSTRARAA